MPRTRLVPLAAALTLCGCAYTNVLRLDSMVRPQTHPDSVRLLAQEPQQPYTVIAIVSAGSAGWPFEGIPRTRLLKAAARLGGEAVLLDNASLTVVSSGESTQQRLTGKVVVFRRQAQANDAQ